MNAIFNQIFNGNSTKNPERLIESIKEMNLVKNSTKQFYIECFEENPKGSVKRLVFETKNGQTASYIFAKLNFLMYFILKQLHFLKFLFLGNKDKKLPRKRAVKTI